MFHSQERCISNFQPGTLNPLRTETERWSFASSQSQLITFVIFSDLYHSALMQSSSSSRWLAIHTDIIIIIDLIMLLNLLAIFIFIIIFNPPSLLLHNLTLPRVLSQSTCIYLVSPRERQLCSRFSRLPSWPSTLIQGPLAMVSPLCLLNHLGLAGRQAHWIGWISVHTDRQDHSPR